LNTLFHIPQQALLHSAIHAIWQVEDDNEIISETIIPKGVVEIIFDFGETKPVHAKLGGK
jgi:hypothetical protein